MASSGKALSDLINSILKMNAIKQLSTSLVSCLHILALSSPTLLGHSLLEDKLFSFSC